MITDPIAQAFHRVAVVDAWDETRELGGVALDLGALGQKHTRPGQVVKLRLDDGSESFFALANAPHGDGRAELLVKRGSAAADALLAAARPGATVLATAPFGDGFPVEAARGRDVLLFAAGSGITPVHALLSFLLDHRGDFGRIALYYGQRSDRDFAYVREHAAWVDAGVHLVLCASQPSAAWTGARGYVQTVAHELKLHEISTENAVAFLCGMKSMIDDVGALLRRYGLPREREFLNF